ncbi:GldM family protein [Lishizhenia sp.]|uniref:type IX secretion system motor protein PorM/GldM n=1 Tax=Lishizhenia sp. TaxID=2497594 RepID=UPI00299D936B|nr:GldM family protein [Lishizhenia sp.]MDX1445869.1 GldM family protein [Lishizhenia sp.]
MAGGKETPRQKMIGMMYLVLTALLALNVSKTILDAFVTFDNNIKDGTLTIAGQGNEAYIGIQDMATNTDEPGRMKAAKKYLPAADSIKALTNRKIEMLNEMRDEMLTKTGEDLSAIKSIEDEGTVYERTVYNLEKVNGKDNYDVPMEVMVGPEIKSPDPKREGMRLWNEMNNYRDDLVRILAEASSNKNQKYTFDASREENVSSLDSAQIDERIKKTYLDDRNIVKQIYSQLTKVERADVHNGEIKNIHWVGRTFDHAPIVAALATLSSIEQELRTAEAMAMKHLRTKIGSSEYSFNKIQPLATAGSNYFNNGDSIELQVLMAAYDEYQAPKVLWTTDSTQEPKEVNVTYRDGKGYIKVKADGAGPKQLSGTIAIKKKNGTEAVQPWKFDYEVGAPSGEISLPDMRILYIGYDNKVTGAASGFNSFNLKAGNNVGLTKKGDHWIAKPRSRGKASISIVGISGDKSVTLNTVEFEARPLPNPELKLGSIESGAKASKSALRAATRLFASYGPDVPLTGVKFTVKSWEVSVAGAPRPVKGTGASITAAQSLLKQAPSGAIVQINTRVVGPDGVTRRRNMSFTIQ